MLITAIRLGGLVVKTFVYQPTDPGSNPGKGNFFFQKNAKLSRRIYASLPCKGLKSSIKQISRFNNMVKKLFDIINVIIDS